MLAGPEVRQFGHSGMITELIDRGWHIIAAVSIIDDDIVNQLDPRVKLIPLIHEPLPENFHRLQKILDQAYQILESKKGKTKWIDASLHNTSTFRGRINNKVIEHLARWVSHSSRLYESLLKVEQNLEMKQVSDKWVETLKKWNINAVVVNAPRSEVIHPALTAAKKLGIPRLLFYHSIKDISGKGRLIHDFNSIGVWNTWMEKELIRQNQAMINPGVIRVAGCAHFDCVGREDILLPEERFRKMIGAAPSSRLLLYPAAVPWVVPDEGRYVWLMVKAIETGVLPKDIQIVIRTNPGDLSHYYENNFNSCKYVIVHKSDWRMEESRGWGFQRRSDMILFNSLLHYSSVCVGIPSTVTIECAISCLPVINIGFDLPDPRPPRSMKVFWNAEFYQEEVRHGVAILCENEKDLMEKINTALVAGKRKPQEYERYLSDFLGIMPHFSALKYVKMIEESVSE